MSQDDGPMSWPVLIGILLGTALLTGLVVGFLGTIFPLSMTVKTGGIGGVVGIVAGILLARRNAES